MGEVAETVQEAVERADGSKLHSAIAILVAIAATIMALGNIKDGNIVQGMAQDQAKAVDAWSYYQAKSTKQNLAEGRAEAFEVQLAVTKEFAPEARMLLEAKRSGASADAKRYGEEKASIKKEAESLTEDYDRLNLHDDQFDISEACLTVAIALFGITALTRKKWLFAFASALMGLGTLMAIAGFAGWALHPDWLAKLLG